VPSMELVVEKTGNEKVAVLAETLDQAISKYLENGRLPSRHRVLILGGNPFLLNKPLRGICPGWKNS